MRSAENRDRVRGVGLRIAFVRRQRGRKETLARQARHHGNCSALNRCKCASSVQFSAPRLPKPKPGSRAMRSGALPAASACPRLACSPERTSGSTCSADQADWFFHSLGRPRVCIRIAPHCSCAMVCAMSASHRRPDTSLTISAPASTASRAVPARYVSTERRVSGRACRMPRRTGSTRACSSALAIAAEVAAGEPGRVDSPPTSSRSAPLSSSQNA